MYNEMYDHVITERRSTYSTQNALGMMPIPSLLERTKGRLLDFPGTSFKRLHVYFNEFRLAWQPCLKPDWLH